MKYNAQLCAEASLGLLFKPDMQILPNYHFRKEEGVDCLCL